MTWIVVREGIGPEPTQYTSEDEAMQAARLWRLIDAGRRNAWVEAAR